jgi:hypothetical protein
VGLHRVEENIKEALSVLSRRLAEIGTYSGDSPAFRIGLDCEGQQSNAGSHYCV